MLLFCAGSLHAAETDFYMRLPMPTAERLKAVLPLEILPSGMRALPKWEGKMLWHERTDLDPALNWFRNIVLQILRRSDGIGRP